MQTCVYMFLCSKSLICPKRGFGGVTINYHEAEWRITWTILIKHCQEFYMGMSTLYDNWCGVVSYWLHLIGRKENLIHHVWYLELVGHVDVLKGNMLSFYKTSMCWPLYLCDKHLFNKNCTCEINIYVKIFTIFT